MTAPSNSVPDGRGGREGRGGEGSEWWRVEGRRKGGEGRERRGGKREARRGWCTYIHTYVLHTRIYYIYSSLTNTPHTRLPYTHDSPLPVLMVAGLKAFHTMVSQMLVAMKRDMLQEGGMQQETSTHTREGRDRKLQPTPHHTLCYAAMYETCLQLAPLPLPLPHSPRPQPVSLLQQLVQQKDHQTSHHQLDDDQDAHPHPQL